jgi:hypothetical protein
MIQETGQLEFDLTNTRQEKADWEQRNTSELKKLERKQVVQLSEWINSNKQASQPAVAVVSQQLQDISDHLPPSSSPEGASHDQQGDFSSRIQVQVQHLEAQGIQESKEESRRFSLHQD